MTMMELKSILVHRISEINDLRFLEAIKTILDEKAEDSTLLLSDDQRKEIAHSQKEVTQGQIISDDDLDNEIQEWLNVK
jgi:hypothetical protein